MNENLTAYEQRILLLMETSGRWDGLRQELSLGLPSLVIIAFGLRLDSWIVMLSGVITYATLRLWTVLQQDAMSPHIQSAVRKLRQQAEHSAPVPAPSAAKIP